MTQMGETGSNNGSNGRVKEENGGSERRRRE